MQRAVREPIALARTMAWLLVLECGLSACGGAGDAERAAQSARLATLEQEVQRLGARLAALTSVAPAPSQPVPPPSSPAKAFSIACPQPWQLHIPLGASLWSCRAPLPTADGLYAQCNVVAQPQFAIETKNYFEFALNAVPQLHEVRSFADKPTKIGEAEGFEATFEADPKPVPLKLMSALMPHGETTYAITCSAPRASFDKYGAGFRQIIDTFTFN
jgi:hypothetical protein